MGGYTATINDGREIFIPSWPVNVQLENLTNVSKYLGAGHVINMASLDLQAVKVAIMSAEDPAQTAKLIKHFICQVRIDGSKIDESTMDEMFQDNLKVVAELFAHVIHSQYADFFDLGQAKEASPEA